MLSIRCFAVYRLPFGVVPVRRYDPPGPPSAQPAQPERRNSAEPELEWISPDYMPLVQ